MPLTLGADPEFLFKNKGEFIPANDRTIFGTDRERTLHAKIGTDGHAQTAELRPSPHYDAVALSSEIQKMIAEVWAKYGKPNGYSAHAGSMGGEGAYKAIAGHIHFGIKKKTTIEGMVPYLDVPSLMLLFIEDYDENTIRRRQRGMDNTHYGDLTSYRTKRWGFEYRTPGSWLISPAMTRGYLALYHATAHDFLRNKFDAKHPFTKLKKWIEKYEVHSKFRSAEHDAFKYKLKTTIKGIKELTMYKKNYKNYRPYINNILSLVNCGKQWNENRDMFETWGHLKNTEPQALFNFQIRDYNIKKVKIPNLKMAHTGNKLPIRVFGLTDKGSYTLCTNSEEMIGLINKFNKEYGTTKALVPKMRNVYNNSNVELGVGRTLRDAKTDLIKDLLRFIKKNHKSLI